MNDRLNKDNTYSIDIIITLLAILAMSCFYHGLRALIICLISAASCYFFEAVALKLRGKNVAFHDYSAVITGLIIGLMMPASIKYSMIIVISFIAIIVGKHVFGGSGCEIFNPAAVAYVFAALCWPLQVLMYPQTTTKLSLENYVDITPVASFTSQFNSGSIVDDVDIETLLGYFDGPIGSTQILVIIVCAIVLLLRRSISASAFLGFIGTFMAISFFMPALTEMDLGDYLFYEFSSNMLLFAALFIVADYRFLPSGSLNRFIIGALTACFTLIFRRVGEIENPVLFAVLIANPFTDVVDNYRIRFIAFIRNNENNENEDVKNKDFFDKIMLTLSTFGKMISNTVIKIVKAITALFNKNSKSNNSSEEQPEIESIIEVENE